MTATIETEQHDVLITVSENSTAKTVSIERQQKGQDNQFVGVQSVTLPLNCIEQLVTELQAIGS